MSYFRFAQATVRLAEMATGIPFPSAAYVDTPTMMVTAAGGNGGTVYLCACATTTSPGITSLGAGRGATIRETTMIPLAAGESVTFTGQPIGSGGDLYYRFGTGYSYLFGSATSQKIICTYAKLT